VVNGDSLWSISLKLKVTFPALLSANNLVATSLILPGQQLIPPPGAVDPATVATTTPATTSSAKASTKTAATATTVAAPPAAPPAAGTTSTPTSYTVVSGDYLYGIARNFAVPFGALLAANNFVATSAIFPGRPITIPAGATTTPKTTTTPNATAKVPATATATATANIVAPNAPATKPATPQHVNIAPTGNSKLDAVLAFAVAQLGKPYVFAGAGPDTYDCSGLVLAAYAQAGIQLIHQSAVQSTEGTAVDWKTSPILPGDLVFTAGSATPGLVSHVGMAINSTQWIQSPRPNSGVQIGLLPASEKILAVRRFISH
jgi:cell wall-associated NlpC family hydrolase